MSDHTVIVTINTSLSEPVFPADTVSAGIQVALLDASNAFVLPPVMATSSDGAVTQLAASFSAVPVGVYTVSATAIDNKGNPLGDAITASVVVVDKATLVSITIPSAISVAVV